MGNARWTKLGDGLGSTRWKIIAQKWFDQRLFLWGYDSRSLAPGNDYQFDPDWDQSMVQYKEYSAAHIRESTRNLWREMRSHTFKPVQAHPRRCRVLAWGQDLRGEMDVWGWAPNQPGHEAACRHAWGCTSCQAWACEGSHCWNARLQEHWKAFMGIDSVRYCSPRDGGDREGCWCWKSKTNIFLALTLTDSGCI